MSLSKASHIIEELAKKDPFFKAKNISCWLKLQGKLSIFLFSQVFDSADELVTSYKLLRDHIAVSFQSQAEISGAQRWNIYIFYFVREQVTDSIKQAIEQDKFSSRKIVCSDFQNEINDDIICQQIDAELFDLKFSVRNPPGKSLENLLKEKFPAVHKSLSVIDSLDTYEALDPLINLLKNE